MSTELFDLYSERDGAGEMYLRTANLVVDSDIVAFEEGVARGIPASVVTKLGHRTDLRAVPAAGSGQSMAEIAAAAAEPRDTGRPEAASPITEPKPPAAPKAKPRAVKENGKPLDVEKDAVDAEAILAAQAYLEAEGMEVPEPITEPQTGEGEAPADGTTTEVQLGDVRIPDGFESQTADDHPRCLAAKGDGSQCQNAAKLDGDTVTWACGLAQHKDQVKELRAAA